jgi:hypothetical protein
MNWFMSLVLWIVTLVRVAIAVLLASLGMSTILATAFRMVYHPMQGDFSAIVLWMAKPLAVALILLALAYLISRTLTKFQKFIIVTVVFLISVMSLYSLVSGMDWTASLQAQSPGVMGAPINMLKQITTTLQGVTGV